MNGANEVTARRKVRRAPVSRFGAGIVTALAVAVLVGCNRGSSPDGNVSCSSMGRCPKDPPNSASDISACEAQLADSCGAKFQAYIDCGSTAMRCTQDGTEDVSATLAAGASQCAGIRQVWNDCERNLVGGDGSAER